MTTRDRSGSRTRVTSTGAHLKKSDVGTWSGKSKINLVEDVLVVVTQAYGPTGKSLVGVDGVEFDGYAALALDVKAGDHTGRVYLSPIHGDPRKRGMADLPLGTKCELYCPVSGQQLDYVGEVGDGSGAEYWAIYLTEDLSKGEMVQVSDVWGHYHSRVVDDFEMLSVWADSEDAVHEESSI